VIWPFNRRPDRELFHYRDGAGPRKADPLAAEAVLIERLG
jgi:hypothetical protein